MDILFNSFLIMSGLLLLYYGGHFLVKGATALALKFRIPAIVVGLTVVAFGTSAPELFVSLLSALRGYTEISLGNVVGSNIINIALILGISACIIPIAVGRGIIRRDIPLMFLSYLILFAAALPLALEGLAPGEGKIFRIEGLLMVAALFAYVFFLYSYSRAHESEAAELVEMDAIDHADASRPLGLLLFQIIAGIVALALGSELLISGASWLARNIFNASDRFIGITIIALGTSLPELMTSVIAAARKQMDISVGNIVGSNIFNSLMVLGVTSLVRPLSIQASGFLVDIIVMIVISLLLFLITAVWKKLGRIAGLTFLLTYAGYFVYLLQTRTV